MSFNRKRRLKNPNPFNEEYGAGAIVRSLAGRSRGKTYVVTETFTDKYGKLFATVADGVKYTISEPKPKSVKHLEVLGSIAKAKTDEEIRKLLSEQ